MGRQVAVALYVVAMVAVIIGVDFVLQKPIFLGTVGIVLVFAAFYFKFLKRP